MKKTGLCALLCLLLANGSQAADPFTNPPAQSDLDAIDTGNHSNNPQVPTPATPAQPLYPAQALPQPGAAIPAQPQTLTPYGQGMTPPGSTFSAPPAAPAPYGQPWPQAPQWPAQQPWGGAPPPGYMPGAPMPFMPRYAAPRPQPNPLSDELNTAQETLHTKETELKSAQDRINQLTQELAAKSDAEKQQGDKIDYLQREENALRIRITDLTKTQDATNTLLQQSRHLIDNFQIRDKRITEERDRMKRALSGLEAQVNDLQAALRQALSETTQQGSSPPP